jgi:hypothetical protein
MSATSTGAVNFVLPLRAVRSYCSSPRARRDFRRPKPPIADRVTRFALRVDENDRGVARHMLIDLVDQDDANTVLKGHGHPC